MKRVALLALLALAGAGLGVRSAAAAEWHSQQPIAAGIEAPAPLGQIGDVEFWAPNRGMLITAGTGGSPAGLFAYDGSGWYRYSTVCGGHEGRIAWAGPDEFWTISDQPLGQETGKAPPQHISLCHFKDGQVVASYAEPVGQAGSYLPMNAAACAGPSDCWFAGDRLPGTNNVGAFHLHWDGTALTAIPLLIEPQSAIVDPGRSVESLAFEGGTLYESVAVAAGDAPTVEEEEASEPSFVHRVEAGGAKPFEPLFPTQPIDYGGSDPTELEAFRLSRDDQGLWAVAGALGPSTKVTALRLEAEGLEQIALDDPSGALGAGTGVGGLGAEPGGDAWLGFQGSGEGAVPPARLAHVHPDGTVEAPISLPVEGKGLSRKGAAGPIACPADEQCWMATALGWLFHLGPDPSQDTDPSMHVLVSYRPPDNSLPSVPPISLPVDDSESEPPPSSELEPVEEPFGDALPRSLYSKLKQHLIGKRVLEMTFVLHVKAHVRLVARRKGDVVADTPRYTMAKGPRSVRLRLDPKRWPTKLDLQVHAVKTKGKS
ncbi:MAG TPA: hypothetical protein VF245_08215 [Solirubrobacterales bacterium]